MRRQRNLLGPQGMGGMVGLWGASSLIKSIQRGTIALSGGLSATATITAVDVNNSVISYLGNTAPSTNISAAQIRMELTNTTTVTATVGGAAGAQIGVYEVIEFYPGVIRSVQRGTIAVNGVTSNTGTITAVNTAKAQLMCLGMGTNVATVDDGMGGGVLTNGTTITVTKTTATNNLTYGYQVVEYF